MVGQSARALSLKLIGEFGSLAAVLAASPRRRRLVLTEAPAAAEYLDAVRGATLHTLRDEALLGPTIAGTEALARYLRADMGCHPNEQLRVLFLTAELRLLSDEVMIQGTVDSATLLPRPIVHRALDLGAAGLILIHNHPSGVPEPSPADLQATKTLRDACRPMELYLFDHLIVARRGWVSFRVRNLL